MNVSALAPAERFHYYPTLLEEMRASTAAEGNPFDNPALASTTGRQ